MPNRLNIGRHVLFTEGKIEVQDEGSQLLAHLVAAKRGMMVADFCAGAGGKTLAIGALMRNTGRLYAFDVSEKRLHNLGQRLKRSGLSNLNAQVISSETDPKLKRLNGKFDRVLVDAPCSGLGTLRRNPDLKWRQTPQDVAELNVKQTNILARAAKLTKVGGRLIYATCSLLRDENEQIAEHFLATHPDFKLMNAAEILAQHQIQLDTGDYLKLLPHLHNTDGFFAAVFEKLDAASVANTDTPAEKSTSEEAPDLAVAPESVEDVSATEGEPVKAKVKKAAVKKTTDKDAPVKKSAVKKEPKEVKPKSVKASAAKTKAVKA
jgi:16S rRNA (cytosine967-C5)-methyltransferase